MSEPVDGRSPLFDPQALHRLLRSLEGTDVDELEVMIGASRIYLRREPEITGAATWEPSQERHQSEGVSISSPLTGVFYSRPTPEQAPFVEPGSRVEKGDVVALVETMKLFNEVTSDVTGEVLAITARDGDLVESGQPLILIRPAEEEERS